MAETEAYVEQEKALSEAAEVAELTKKMNLSGEDFTNGLKKVTGSDSVNLNWADDLTRYVQQQVDTNFTDLGKQSANSSTYMEEATKAIDSYSNQNQG